MTQGDREEYLRQGGRPDLVDKNDVIRAVHEGLVRPQPGERRRHQVRALDQRALGVASQVVELVLNLRVLLFQPRAFRLVARYQFPQSVGLARQAWQVVRVCRADHLPLGGGRSWSGLCLQQGLLGSVQLFFGPAQEGGCLSVSALGVPYPLASLGDLGPTVCRRRGPTAGIGLDRRSASLDKRLPPLGLHGKMLGLDPRSVGYMLVLSTACPRADAREKATLCQAVELCLGQVCLVPGRQCLSTERVSRRYLVAELAQHLVDTFVHRPGIRHPVCLLAGIREVPKPVRCVPLSGTDHFLRSGEGLSQFGDGVLCGNEVHSAPIACPIEPLDRLVERGEFTLAITNRQDGLFQETPLLLYLGEPTPYQVR